MRADRQPFLLLNGGEAVAFKRGDPHEIAAEADILARCAHPSVVEMICLVRTEHMTGIVLERLEAFDMLLSRRGQLNAWELEDAFGHLAIALDHLEQMCILHRDVKPQNLLCSRESYKLADFGDALVLPVPMDSAVCLAGSPKYWPPEGAKVLDFRRDVYALGLTFFECTQHLDLARVCSSMMQPLETRPHARDVQIMLHQTGVPAELPLKKMRRAIPGL